eukprot:193329-Chlamydomonas_euryale.AAC.3
MRLCASKSNLLASILHGAHAVFGTGAGANPYSRVTLPTCHCRDNRPRGYTLTGRPAGGRPAATDEAGGSLCRRGARLPNIYGRLELTIQVISIPQDGWNKTIYPTKQAWTG